MKVLKVGALVWVSLVRSVNLIISSGVNIHMSAFLAPNDETFKSGVLADRAVPLGSFSSLPRSGCRNLASEHIRGNPNNNRKQQQQKHLSLPSANKNTFLFCTFYFSFSLLKSVDDRIAGAPGAAGCL